MAENHPGIGEFDETKETWNSYIERLNQYFIVYDTPNDKKVPHLLMLIGATTYGLLKNLLDPELPSTKQYDELVQVLRNHFSPTPLTIFERFQFYNRLQKEGESVAVYFMNLKKLAATCDFGEFLEQAIRDRLVCGLRNEAIQRRLLATRELTMRIAFETASAMELADKNSQELRPNQNSNLNTSVNGNGLESKTVNKVSNERYNYGKRKPVQRKFSQANNQQRKERNAEKCYRCGNSHNQAKCPFRSAECYLCNKRGHIAKVCRSKRSQSEYDTRLVEQDEFGLYTVYKTTQNSAYMVTFNIDNKPVNMEIDTGAALTLFNEHLYQREFSHLPLQPVDFSLKTYLGESVPILGQFETQVNYGDQLKNLPVVVVKGDNPIVVGRNWLQHIKLDWRNVFKVDTNQNCELDTVLAKYPQVFEEGFGIINGFKANIRLKKDTVPLYFKPRPVPYAVKDLVSKELNYLEQNGIITKVPYSAWATPIVTVPKPDPKTIRLCGDYKVTVNRCIEVQQYPIPAAEEIFATLAGGRYFSKLDLSNAYQQLELDEPSRKVMTINTHQGLYCYNRLPFGVASAPAIFQCILEQILQGVDGVMCRLDDILISASSKEEHLKKLDIVLKRLTERGVKLKKAKCAFMQPSVKYLGHRIDCDGIHPLPDKVAAIEKASTPRNVSELKSFLGLINYYGKFLPNLSSTLHPLHELLQKDFKWKWTQDCDRAFDLCKQKLLQSKLLIHYDANKPLKLACDASSYGLGAVISHIDGNGQERPIAFASRTLSPSEKNYSQLEREALSIIFGIKKFHQYLYGRRFTLETDHKALTTILGPHTAVPTLAAARLQRWALILSAYSYDIVYRRSEDHANADAMSRCPSQQDTEEKEIHYFSYLEELPVDSKRLADATRKDSTLSRVYDFTLNGWPNSITHPDLVPYSRRKDELTTEQGCLLWGVRVIIPTKYRQQLLDDLHEVHPGMSRMKSLARSYLWWPSLDQDIEQKVRNCQSCLSLRNSPPPSPLKPWVWPKRPWQRIHLDFAEFQKQQFLIVIDSHSKWLEVFQMQTTTSSKTIETLRTLFARYGLPEDVVSDNGPQFTSQEFKDFLRNNGIRQILTPPYHPSSNGAAERSVQIVKQSLLKQVLHGNRNQTLQHRLDNFLFMYRITTHTVTGNPPCELFLKRMVRNRFTLLKPHLESSVEKKQQLQKNRHDIKSKVRHFSEGQCVSVKNFWKGKERWIPGRVIRKLGEQTFLVRTGGKTGYCHIDHLLPNVETSDVNSHSQNTVLSDTRLNDSDLDFPLQPTNPPMQMPPLPNVPLRRYPQRIRRIPDKLDL